MEITEVHIFPVSDKMLKAYATFTIDNCFVVRDLKIIQGRKGIFVAMPSRRKADGTYKDTAHPLDSDTRQRIQERVLNEYWKMTKDRNIRIYQKISSSLRTESGR